MIFLGFLRFRVGLVTNTAVGPLIDVSAYSFAPQSLVAPFGGLLSKRNLPQFFSKQWLQQICEAIATIILTCYILYIIIYISLEIMRRFSHTRSRCGLERSLGAFHSQREVNKVAKMCKNASKCANFQKFFAMFISTCSSRHFWNFRGLDAKFVEVECRHRLVGSILVMTGSIGSACFGNQEDEMTKSDEIGGKRSEPRIWRRVKGWRLRCSWRVGPQLCQWNWNRSVFCFFNIF